MLFETQFIQLVKNIESKPYDFMQFVEQIEPNTIVYKNTSLLHMLFRLHSSMQTHKIFINNMIELLLQKVPVITYNDVYESITWMSKNNIVLNYKAEEFTYEQKRILANKAIITKNMNLLLYNDVYDIKQAREYNKSVKKMTHPVIGVIYCLQKYNLSLSDIVEEFVSYSDFK